MYITPFNIARSSIVRLLPSAIGAAFCLPAAKATKLLNPHHWGDVDVVRFELPLEATEV